MRRPFDQPRTWIVVILAAAFVIRSFGLASRPIWYDEAFSILFAEKGLAAMLQGTLAAPGVQAAEEHPLGYYFVLWGWMGVFGRSLPAVRLLSILAGTASVGLIYLIARALFTERIGLLAALLTAVSPFQVHYSQEIRMYIFLGFWLLLATHAFLRARRSLGWKWWAVFTLAAALAQYTHTLASLYLIPLALTPLLQRDWRTVKAVLLSGLGAVLLYLPWLVHIPSQIDKLDSAYWITRPGVDKLFTLLLVYVTNLPLPDGGLMPVLGLSVFVLFIALWQTYLAARRRDAGWAGGLWLLYLASAPPLLSFLISQWQPVFLERSFLPSGAIFCAWLAWALFATRLPRPLTVVTAAGLAACALIGLSQHALYAGFPYAPYREIQADLTARIQPGDAVIHSSKLSLLPAHYFDPALSQVFIADPPRSNVDTLAPATQKVLGVVSSPTIEAAANDSQRVWFIIFQQSSEEYGSAGQVAHPHLVWLGVHYQLISEETRGDLRLYLYSR